MLGNCDIEHDWFTAFLTFGLCIGLVVSYLPQHLRFIKSKSSEGWSPFTLFLGTASNASAMLNMVTMQSGVLKCCASVGPARCLEISAGVVQLSIQWICFTLIFVLYMKYYPEHLKYEEGVQLPLESNASCRRTMKTEWRQSIVMAWVTAIHFILAVFITLFALASAVPSPSAGEPLPPLLYSWARFLGVTSAIFASVQYPPQILRTYQAKVVGALSIPMMCIQSPGGLLMVLSIALRPGTNWTSWLPFAVAAVLQGTLLVLCLCWKARQNRLGIDDFGNPLDKRVSSSSSPAEPDFQVEVPVAVNGGGAPPAFGVVGDERTPLLRG